METQFNYEIFDRQAENLIELASLMIEGWDDHSSMEMNLELKLLNSKASRLCVMADTDRVMQTDNPVQERSEANLYLYELYNTFANEILGPFTFRIVNDIREGKGMKGKPNIGTAYNVYEVLPEIESQIGCEKHFDEFADTMKKLQKSSKSIVFPGINDAGRLIMFFELYAKICYMLLHFQTMNKLTNTEISPDEMGRLLIGFIQQYSESDEGHKELDRYLTSLKFDNSGIIDEYILKNARIELRKEVPPCLQLCFMQHIDDIDELGRNLLEVEDKSPDDVRCLIGVIAKWQMLTEELEKILHPFEYSQKLRNEVFHERLHSNPVDLVKLKEKIRRMLPFVTKKNHWFCVWSVLKYHNLIKDTNMEAFARQMQSADWFGNEEGLITFKGENLTEYNGYFTETNFKSWNNTTYNIYRQAYNKKKWGETMCENFIRVCNKMEDAYCGK